MLLDSLDLSVHQIHVIRRLCKKCAGINGSGSQNSEDTNVNGQLLRTASISTMIVSRVGSDTCCLPKIFLIAVLVKPINRSQKPPYQGALLGINCHETLSCPVHPSLQIAPSECVVHQLLTSRLTCCPRSLLSAVISAQQVCGRSKGTYQLLDTVLSLSGQCEW